MASITIRLTSTCSGGNHRTFSVTGDVTTGFTVDQAQLLESLSDEDKVSFVKGLIKLGKIGRTNAQLIALFQSGVTVTV